GPRGRYRSAAPAAASSAPRQTVRRAPRRRPAEAPSALRPEPRGPSRKPVGSLDQLLVILLHALLVLLRRLLLHRVEQLLAELLRPAPSFGIGDLDLLRVHVARFVLALLAGWLAPGHRHPRPALALPSGLLGHLLHGVLELLQLLERLLLAGLRAARLALAQPLLRAPHPLLGLLQHLLVLGSEDGHLPAHLAQLVTRLLQ